MADAPPTVVAEGRDERGPWRRVRLSNGWERVQRPHVTVETEITRADGTVEPGGEITDIQVRSIE